MNLIRPVVFFSAGFMAGAHRYHLEYYCPAVLNPLVVVNPRRTMGPFDDDTDYDLITVKNDMYYKDLEKKMKAY